MADGTARGSPLRKVLLALVGVLILLVVLVSAVAFEARNRLPELVVWVVAELVPGVDLELRSARLESSDTFVAEGVRVSLEGAAEPVFTAETLEVGFAWAEVMEGRVREVRVARPQLRWTPDSSGPLPFSGGEETEATWTVDHVVATNGSAELVIPDVLPETRFGFEVDLRDLGPDVSAQRTAQALSISELRVGSAQTPLLTVAAVDVEASLAELEAGHVRSLEVVRPSIDTTELPPFAGGGGSDEGLDVPDFRVDRLLVKDGRVRAPASRGALGVEAGFSFDGADVGTATQIESTPQTLPLTDVSVWLPGGHEPLLHADALSVEFSVDGLLRSHQVGAIRLPDGSVLIDEHARTFFASSSDLAAAAEGGGGDEAQWLIRTVDLGTLSIHVSELGPPLPDVTFDVHTTLYHLPLSGAAAKIADETQKLELASLALYSPFDPFHKVVNVGSIFVEFTLAGLMQQEIASVKLVRPTIYLSEDLFWYMTAERSGGAAGPPVAWRVADLSAELGSLILELGRVRTVGLPITFETHARDVRLDNLADLQLAAVLKVPEESYSFPDFDLNLERVHGELQFDYPPGKGSENFVSTLYATAVSWQDFTVEEGWISLTFDSDGINGKLGAKAYDGYVNGGLTLPYATTEPVSVWASGTALDLTDLTAVAAGGRVEMTGPLDAKLVLTAVDQALQTATGDLTLAKPGRLEIRLVKEEDIPPDWPSWQQDLAKIALRSLSSFEYDEGRGNLAFKDGVGLATLNLDGPNGARNLEIHYQADGSDPLDVLLASREDTP